MFKKFFTFVCAIAIALCASATPIVPKAKFVKKAPVAVKQMQKVQLEKAQVTNFNQLSAAKALKVTNQKVQAPAVNLAAQRRSAQAQDYNSTYDYKCGPTEVVVTDLSTPTYNEFKLAITQKAKNTSEYSKQTLYDNTVEIILDPDEHSIVGTFTTADYTMSPSSYLKSGSNTRYVSAYEPSTITIESKGGNKYAITDGLLQVENNSGTYLYKYNYCYDVADLNDQTAEKTAFEFTFGENPEPAQDSIVTATVWSYNDYWYDVYLANENTTYIFELAQSTGGLTHGTTYTFADMYADWVCTLDDEGNPLVKATDATLTVTKDQDGLIHIAATMVLDGVTHVISYDEAPFVPSGVKDTINGTNLSGKYNSTNNFYVYTGKVGNNTAQLVFNTTEEQATYTKDLVLTDYCVYYSPDYSTYVEFVKAASDFTVTTTETTKTLAGSLYAANGDEYFINLVWEKPTAEEITAIVEDATLTKKTLFFMVDGNDTEHQYGITVKVNSKVLEGEFTLTDCDTWNTGVTDLTAKKWFDTDSCYISTKVLGSNTLLMEGILYTHNTSLGRLINAQFSLTARIDANGELMNSYGGIVSPAKGDTLSFTRSNEGTAFFLSSTEQLTYANQNGKTTMIAVNDSAYYWLNPISKYPANYWIKGIKDKQTNAIVFDTAQVIYVHEGGFSSKMKWYKATAGGHISPDFEYSDVFALDIKGAENDSLVLRGSAPFDFTQDIHFPGVCIDGIGFQGYGDAGTILTLNKPITERDTVDIVIKGLMIQDLTAKHGEFVYVAENANYYAELWAYTDTPYGTFSLSNGKLDPYSAIVTTEGEITIQDGEITVSEEDGANILTGWVIGMDEKYYRLNLTKPAGALDYDTDVPFDVTFAYGNMVAAIEDGKISIYADDAKRILSLTLFTDPANGMIPAGTYTISDSQEAGTALQSIGLINDGIPTDCWAGMYDADGSIRNCWFLVEGSITLSYDDYDKLKVTVDATNSLGQPVKVTIAYTKLEPKSEVSIEADNMIFTGAENKFLLTATNADYQVSLLVYSSDTAGTYSVIDLEPSYSYIYTAQGNTIPFLDGDFTLALDGKDMTLTGALLGSDTIQYNLSLTGIMGALVLDQNSDFEATFDLDSALVQPDAQTGTTIVNVLNEDDAKAVILQFFAIADGNKLPEGTYPINGSKEANTVLASQGVVDIQYSYSFACTVDAQGNVNEAWFIVGGEVVVDENGSITVNGVNSYGKTVQITINKQSTDLYTLFKGQNEKIATKFFHRGHIIIRKGNKHFNMLGAEL